MVEWNGKTTASVLASGFVASTVAPGAVYCSEKFFPDQMTGAKKWVARHIVEPYPKLFAKLSKGIDAAHEKYDKKRREEQIRNGEPVEDIPVYTPEQRACFIADALVQSSVALGSDFAATYGFLKLLNKWTKSDNKAGRVTFIDAAVTLGGIAVLPTLFAGASENFHHGLRKMLQKTAGLSKESADRVAMSATYIGVPSLLGTAAGLLGAHVFARR